MSTRGVWFVRAYVDLADGDILAALMLSQIAFWNQLGKTGKRKLKIQREGVYWLAKSANDWREELGFTQKQAYRCIGVLVKNGLIETRTMKFNGTPTIHSRLTSKGEQALKLAYGDSLMASGEDSFPLEEKSLTETTSKKTTDMDPAGEPAETVNPEEQSGKHKDGATKEKNGGNAIGTLWKEKMLLRYPGYEKQLTKKEFGQLKQFKNKLGIEAEEALCFAIDDWPRFALRARRDAGASCPPEYPVIGFLLKYCDVLVMLMHEEKEREAKIAAQKAAAQEAATVSEPTKCNIADDLDMPTLEQIQADVEKWSKKN